MQEMNFYSKWRRASGESVRIDVFCSCKFPGMEGYCYGKILFFINVKDVLYIVLRLYEITQHDSVLESDIITQLGNIKLIPTGYFKQIEQMFKRNDASFYVNKFAHP